jgi:hypothetical protein
MNAIVNELNFLKDEFYCDFMVNPMASFKPSEIRRLLSGNEDYYYENTLFIEDDYDINRDVIHKYHINVLLDFSKIYSLEIVEEYEELVNTNFLKDMMREKNKEIYYRKFYNKLPADVDNYIFKFF